MALNRRRTLADVITHATAFAVRVEARVMPLVKFKVLQIK